MAPLPKPYRLWTGSELPKDPALLPGGSFDVDKVIIASKNIDALANRKLIYFEGRIVRCRQNGDVLTDGGSANRFFGSFNICIVNVTFCLIRKANSIIGGGGADGFHDLKLWER